MTLRTEEVGATIFSAKNIKISNDRLGLTRSAILLVLFIVIHAVGNLHVFKGQRLRIWMVSVAKCVRLFSNFSLFLFSSRVSPLPNLLLTVLLRLRFGAAEVPMTSTATATSTCDSTGRASDFLPTSLRSTSSCQFCCTLVNSQGINVLNLAISGLMLLTFMTIHLFQFRFGDTDQFGPYYIRPPPYLINFWGILSLNLFWTDASYVEPVGVRDIYVEA